MKYHPVLWILATLGGIFIFVVFFSFILLAFTVSQIGEIAQDKSSINIDGDYQLGVVEIKGLITDSKKIIERLNNFASDQDIKGIIVRIDSPGGAVAPAQEIYLRINEIKKKKKVIASLASVAASGGYYIAAACDKIVANPGTLTGSIGVIAQSLNMQELFKFLKLDPIVLKSGKYKDVLSPHRKLLPDERKMMEKLIGDIHNQFKMDVSRGRGMSLAEVEKIADGRVLTGFQALEFGLIDSFGGLDETAKLLAGLAGLEGKYDLVYPSKNKMLYLEEFFQQVNSLMNVFGQMVVSNRVI